MEYMCILKKRVIKYTHTRVCIYILIKYIFYFYVQVVLIKSKSLFRQTFPSVKTNWSGGGGALRVEWQTRLYGYPLTLLTETHILKYFIAKIQGWGKSTHYTIAFTGRMKSEAGQPRLWGSQEYGTSVTVICAFCVLYKATPKISIQYILHE